MRTALVALALVCVCVVRPAAAQAGAERIAYDYAATYASLNPSIVKVHADAGHGSGVLVDARGFVATNHHVVTNARYVAVEYADGRKVAADIVVLDARHDLAILKVHPSTIEGVAPVPLLPAERDHTVRAGLPVLAFGSPRSQTFLMTQGIVSKVEAARCWVTSSSSPATWRAARQSRRRGNRHQHLSRRRHLGCRPRQPAASGAGPSVGDGLLRARARRRAAADATARALSDRPAEGEDPERAVRSRCLHAGWRPLHRDGHHAGPGGEGAVQDDLQQAANRYKRRARRLPTPASIPPTSRSTTGTATPPTGSTPSSPSK